MSETTASVAVRSDDVEMKPKPEDSVLTPPSQPSFPEGGSDAWLTVIGGSMVLFCTFGAVQSFGVYQDYYTRFSLSDKTASEVSWIGSFQVFLLFALGIPVGRLFDEGHFRSLLTAGSIIYVFCLFMLSLAKPHHFYQNFLAQSVGAGLGMGIAFPPSLSIASHYFRARRSIAMGVVIAGSSLGGVIWPIMLNHLIISAGFGWAVRATAFLAMLLLILANIIMKTRLPTVKERPNYVPPNIRSILTDIPYWTCVVGGFFVFWGLFFPFFYLQLFAVEHGVSSNLAFYSITILNAASLFGRTIPNFLADRWGPLNVIIPFTIVSGGLMFAMFGAGSPGGMIVFAILYGFFSGAFISVIAPTISSFSLDINEVGMRIGIGCTCWGFALLTGSPISGALLHEPEYRWKRPIIYNAVLVLFGCAVLTVSRFMMAKRKGTPYV